MTVCHIESIKSKSILARSKVPTMDYCINPYVGCQFGCKYCYASFMSKYCGMENYEWGSYVLVKENLYNVLFKELSRTKDPGRPLIIGSVTDPYQPLEAKYRQTRKVLEALIERKYAGRVTLMTKSGLILRDTDLIKRLNCEVGISVSAPDDEIVRYFEKGVPSISNRLKTLSELIKSGVNAYSFVGPIFPHAIGDPKSLDDIFKRLCRTGVRRLLLSYINLRHDQKRKIRDYFRDSSLDKFYGYNSVPYKGELKKLLKSAVAKYNFELLYTNIIDH